MSEKSVKQQVRELLDRLPDDCSFADVQEEVKRRLREWLKSEKDK